MSDLYREYLTALEGENKARENYATLLHALADAVAVPRPPVDLTRETTIAWVVLHDAEDRAAEIAEAARRMCQCAETARARAWSRWVVSLGSGK
jgi:hypothetical protein